MANTVLSELVTAYVERYSKRFQWDRDMVLRESDLNAWADDEFDDLVRREPEEAWKGVLGVLGATSDELTLSTLAAGPLEDLISRHGHAFIARIEEAAARDSKFKELLHGVWRTGEPAIWERVVRARERGIVNDASQETPSK
jgi:hypothetical protein